MKLSLLFPVDVIVVVVVVVYACESVYVESTFWRWMATNFMTTFKRIDFICLNVLYAYINVYIYAQVSVSMCIDIFIYLLLLSLSLQCVRHITYTHFIYT